MTGNRFDSGTRRGLAVVIAFVVLGLASASGMSLFRPSYDGIWLSEGAHPDAPVFASPVRIAGNELSATGGVIAGDWDNPAAAGGALLNMPPDLRDTLPLEFEWLEMKTDSAWRIAVNVPLDAFEVIDTGPERLLDLVLLYGRNGEIVVLTRKAGKDGSYATQEISYFCAKRDPGRDNDLISEAMAWLDVTKMPIATEAAPESRCK